MKGAKPSRSGLQHEARTFSGRGAMKFLSYLKVALATTLNIILNALTLGRYVWLEGRVRGASS
jgi:hypothetical protein